MAGPSLSSSDQLFLLSPSLSASTSSYDLVSNCSRSSTASQSFHLVSEEDSGDEIVWSISDLSISSDDDYVAPSPTQATGIPSPVGGEGLEPNTPVTAPGRSLESQMTALSSTAIRPPRRETVKVKSVPIRSPASPKASGKQKHGKKNNGQARPPTEVYPSPPQTAKAQKSAAAAPATPSPRVPPKALDEDTSGLGARSIVDDYSDKQSIISYEDNESVGLPTLYEEASTFISSYVLFDYFLSSRGLIISFFTASCRIQMPRPTRSAVWLFYNLLLSNSASLRPHCPTL